MANRYKQYLKMKSWPDCLIPSCPNKCCLALESPYCYPHSFTELQRASESWQVAP